MSGGPGSWKEMPTIIVVHDVESKFSLHLVGVSICVINPSIYTVGHTTLDLEM